MIYHVWNLILVLETKRKSDVDFVTLGVVIWDDDNSAKRALMNVGKYFISQNNKATGHDENVWRIGIQHPKAKQLLMRVATTADKKIKGASSRSMYYLIHGQPKKNKRGLFL